MKQSLADIRKALKQSKPDSERAKVILKEVHSLNAEALKDLHLYIHDHPVPRQTFRNQQFSQFPLTVLQEEEFCLDIYHWHKSHTSLHDHNFEGAFKILKGKYRQRLFSFETKEKIFPWLELGSLKQFSDEILSVGDVVEIPRGDLFIHSTEHVEGECITACLRSSVPEGPLHSYVLPGLKITHTPETDTNIKLMEYILYMNEMGNSNDPRILESMALLDESTLIRMIFSINIPSAFTASAFRTKALQIFKSRHQGKPWFSGIMEAVVSEKLNHIK